MKFTKITPRGLCQGVVDAWVVCKKISHQFPNKKKYLIGWLVHNEHMINDLSKMGIITLGDRNTDRRKIIDQIDDSDNPIVIFSAHGTDKSIIELAKKKGFIVYDTTCSYVTKTHNIIIEKIQEGKKILFIGVNNHPETVAILSLSPEIFLLEKPEDIKNIPFKDNDEIFVTNQTTISILDFYDIVKELKQKYTNIEFKNDICNATLERQQALINMDKSIDLLLVVGDINSNNSKKLVNIGNSMGVESHLVSDLKSINNEWFNSKKHVAITSGCSTPTWVTTEIIKHLDNYFEKAEKNDKTN